MLQDIEMRMGRIREFKNGPRIIDLDILFYNNLEMNSDTLTIPHPLICERKFVLQPLSE
jgi:2-amino-4-hydroxy-6-hydroxymethyldihydropteridine diphosphokinase